MRRSITRTLTAIAAGVVALGMAFAGGATANATAPVSGQSSITINGNGQDLTNRTFEAYRVIDITDVAGAGGSESYTLEIDSTYKEQVRATAQEVLHTATNATDAAVVNKISGMDAGKTRSFAEKLVEKLDAANQTATVRSDKFGSKGMDKQATSLDAGWYLVRETTAASSTPNATTGNAPLSLFMMKGGQNITIDIKSDVPTSHKKIVNADYSNPRDADDFQTNENITYRLTFDIPSNWKTQYKDGFYFTMHDKLSAGLDYVGDPVIKVADNEDEDSITSAVNWDESAQGYGYTPECSQSKDGKTVEWKFATAGNEASDTTNRKANLKLAGKTVVVYYKAKMNASAKIASTGGNGNTYQVYYQHNPGNAADGYDHTTPETPYVYTYQFIVVKQDGDNTDTKLSGAEFKLYSDQSATKKEVAVSFANGVYTVDPNGKAVLTTGTDGKITVNGLDSGTYYLKETKAPSGYKLDDTVREVTVTPDSEVVDAKNGEAIAYKVNGDSKHTMTINNYKGSLPSTGGMGIVLMVVAGVLLIAGGMISIMRRRA